jgi:uncharacterized protein (DUF427 family)
MQVEFAEERQTVQNQAWQYSKPTPAAKQLFHAELR